MSLHQSHSRRANQLYALLDRACPKEHKGRARIEQELAWLIELAAWVIQEEIQMGRVAKDIESLQDKIVSQATQISTQASTITDLQAQLVAAQADALDQADKDALANVEAEIAADSAPVTPAEPGV